MSTTFCGQDFTEDSLFPARFSLGLWKGPEISSLAIALHCFEVVDFEKEKPVTITVESYAGVYISCGSTRGHEM